MPTKRRRVVRDRYPGVHSISAEEHAWLTGEEVPAGANPFWQHVRGRAKVDRCREIIAKHEHLIPPGRRAELLDDIAHWEPKP